MAELNSAEKMNIGYENESSTDVMTGGPDRRRQLYYQLIASMKKSRKCGYHCFVPHGIRSENAP